MKKTVICIIGTRPEAIKMAPVIKELYARAETFETKVVSTGQHGKMLTDVFDFFNIKPDFSLELMVNGQTLCDLTAKAIPELGALFSERKPDWVLVQGDTTSAYAAAYSAFLSGCRVGHIEAGLRTYDKSSPFPEEINRRLIGVLADLHFAPTSRAETALRAEGVPTSQISLTGNTIVDALKDAVEILKKKEMCDLTKLIGAFDKNSKIILVTSHRRENHQFGLANICNALKRFIVEFPNYHVVFQVHPNPAVKSIATSLLGSVRGITLIKPQAYGVFVTLMLKAHFILTDSGGIQEEGPSLGKPVLVARGNTERPEGIEAGCTKLVGTEEKGIFDHLKLLAQDDHTYLKMAEVQNPFGDGMAARRIVDILSVE
jgi:UDP-N-acetylglucosamine 2-epimerase (non-hydrolysing)